MEANERNTPTILPTTLPGVFPPAPPLRIMTGRVIIRPHDATRPIRSSTMNKGRGRAMDDRMQTAQLSHKRPRVVTQGENDDNMPLGCYNDEAGSDEESQVSTQTTWLSSRASPIGGSHHGSTGQSESTSKIRDSLGIDITFELLDMALGEFPYVPLDVLPDLYAHIFGRELVPHDVDPQEFLLSLTKVDGFGYWYLQPEGADLDTSVGLSILERRGHKLEIIRKNITSRLELTEAQESTVVAPLLCYYLALLCCMRASLLTGPILSELFAKATGRSLESLRVVTEHGIQTMTGDELASMVRKWLKDLCSHIAAGDRAQELLDMATQCFDAYAYAHHKNGIAYAWQAMLASNEHASQLLLGIPLIEMRWLYTRLLFLMDMDVDRATLMYLKNLSEQLLGQKK
ncbi:hypothetical protein GGF41_001418 [Coemansia sp. RSA 2531]|nr:hypothetical protein GGF41_001418 [Coemansia sp. RSA 2531]